MFKILWALSPAKFFLTLLVIGLFTFSSCNKSSILGLEVQPPNDLIGADYQDTLTLHTQTVKEDTLRTSGLSTLLLGKYLDPVFGEASSSIYTQLRLVANAPTFGVNPRCDSVRLSLIYAGSYGKKLRKEQIVSVYDLNSTMDINTPYYSNSEIPYNNAALVDYKFIPRPSDSVRIDTSKTKYAPQLRIPLPTEFGKRILDKQHTTDLATNANFMQYIKGFRISTEKTSGLNPSEGNLLSFSMGTSLVSIYYTYYDTLRQKDTQAVHILTLSSVARFMQFKHDYTQANADVQKQVVQKPAPINNDICYAQGASGLKTLIKFPNLVTWGKKDFIGINGAELVITAVSNYKDTFSLPPSLILYGISDDGIHNFPLPDAFDGSDYFGGFLKTDTLTKTSTYTFTITRYIQQIISGSLKNNGLFLAVENGASSPHRIEFGGGNAILTGGGENKYKLKLNVTYTKLK